jgi:hypothetical protein
VKIRPADKKKGLETGELSEVDDGNVVNLKEILKQMVVLNRSYVPLA